MNVVSVGRNIVARSNDAKLTPPNRGRGVCLGDGDAGGGGGAGGEGSVGGFIGCGDNDDDDDDDDNAFFTAVWSSPDLNADRRTTRLCLLTDPAFVVTGACKGSGSALASSIPGSMSINLSEDFI
ncbi:hypothetical protein OAN61_00925 [bacterium]|nr:hypothetical protein [bacterium]